MSNTNSSDRFRISHPDGSITALNEYGHVIGWTECGTAGWSAFWHGRGGDERRWADSSQAAADALAAGVAKEAS